MADDNATPKALRKCVTCEWFEHSWPKFDTRLLRISFSELGELQLLCASGENAVYFDGPCVRYPPIRVAGNEHADPEDGPEDPFPWVVGWQRCGEWRIREGLELVMPDEPTDAPAQP